SAERLARVFVVLDQHDALGGRTAWWSREVDRGRGGERQRHADAELGTAAETFAAHLDPTALHLDQALGDHKPDAQPAAVPLQRRIRLREHVEDTRQHLRADADTGVTHR